ncbi:MAG: class I SAM-dependent methyltransferase [Anaerolineales bacterium]
MTSKDFLSLHLRELPYFRSLVRATEARFYQDLLPLPAPVLDVGSGDGHFASVTFDSPLDVGIDPWTGPIRKSLRYNIYRMVIQGDAGVMPFPDAVFSSALSNSVLEHIPHLDAVLAETARVLKPDAPFIFCVPNHNFLPSLSVGRALDKIGLQPVGNAYRAFFNRISRHHHCDSPEVWLPRLQRAGFRVERYWHYLSPKALAVVEWGHYFGLPSLLLHAVTRQWLLSAADWNLALPDRLTRPYYENPICEHGVYSFYIARRV